MKIIDPSIPPSNLSDALSGWGIRPKTFPFLFLILILAFIFLSTSKTYRNSILEIPIAHNDGNYFAKKDLISELEDNNQIVLQYCDTAGNITEQCNPNGSIKNIAGIINKKGNVFGLMPHPERASDKLLGGMDGSMILKSLK